LRSRGKTHSELQHERAEASARAWDEFFPKLERVACYGDAIALHAEAPPSGSAGRAHYSNLGFFLQTFGPPAGAGSAELGQYIRIFECIAGEGLVKSDSRERLLKGLQSAFAAKFPR
jgi:hypothetical protein